MGSTIMLGGSSTKNTTLLSSVKQAASKVLTKYFTETEIGKVQKKGLDIETAIVSHPITALTKGVDKAVKQFQETKPSKNILNIAANTVIAGAAVYYGPAVAATAAGKAAITGAALTAGGAAVKLGALAAGAPETTKILLSTPEGRTVAVGTALGGVGVGTAIGLEQGGGIVTTALENVGLGDTASKALAAAGLTTAVAGGLLVGTETGRDIIKNVLTDEDNEIEKAYNKKVAEIEQLLEKQLKNIQTVPNLPPASSPNTQEKPIQTAPSTIPQSSTPAVVTPTSTPVIATTPKETAITSTPPSIKITNKPQINIAIAR